MVNTWSLSLVAIVAWVPFLPEQFWDHLINLLCPTALPEEIGGHETRLFDKEVHETDPNTVEFHPTTPTTPPLSKAGAQTISPTLASESASPTILAKTATIAAAASTDTSTSNSVAIRRTAVTSFLGEGCYALVAIVFIALCAGFEVQSLPFISRILSFF